MHFSLTNKQCFLFFVFVCGIFRLERNFAINLVWNKCWLWTKICFLFSLFFFWSSGCIIIIRLMMNQFEKKIIFLLQTFSNVFCFWCHCMMGNSDIIVVIIFDDKVDLWLFFWLVISGKQRKTLDSMNNNSNYYSEWIKESCFIFGKFGIFQKNPNRSSFIDFKSKIFCFLYLIGCFECEYWMNLLTSNWFK